MWTLILLLLFSSFASPVWAQEAAPKEFSFTHLAWAHEVRGYRDYDENEEGEFVRGQMGYAYLEVEGFHVPYVEGVGYVTDLRVDVALKTGGGRLTLFTQRDLIEYYDVSSVMIDSLWFYIWVEIPRLVPRGTYLAEVIVRDLGNGTEIRERQPLVVH